MATVLYAPLSGNQFYVPDGGGGLDIRKYEARGRLSGESTLWVSGFPQGNVYGAKQVRAESTVIIFQLTAYYGQYYIVTDATGNINPAEPSSSFPASAKYYADAFGQSADTALNALNTLGTLGALGAIVATGGSGLGVAVMAKTLQNKVSSYVAPVIALAVSSAVAKFGSAYISSPPSSSSVTITPQRPYIITVADYNALNASSGVVDLSGGTSGSSIPKNQYLPSYNNAYSNYDRTANNALRQHLEGNGSTVGQGLDDIANRAFDEFKIHIQDSFNENNLDYIDPSNDPDLKWDDLKSAFNDLFKSDLTDKLRILDRDLNNTRLEIDKIKTTADNSNSIQSGLDSISLKIQSLVDKDFLDPAIFDNYFKFGDKNITNILFDKPSTTIIESSGSDIN